MRADHLRCEYLEKPQGIDIAEPRLSWVLHSKERAEKQTAYQLLVASSAEKLEQGEGDLWNSGKVDSDQSTQVVYGGAPLRSRMRCYWKVQVWDAKGHAAGCWYRRGAKTTMVLAAYGLLLKTDCEQRVAVQRGRSNQRT